MRNNVIIGFAGRKRSGKSTLAKSIDKTIENSYIISIADNLKFLCADLLCIGIDELNRMKDDGTRFEEKVDAGWISIINRATKISKNDIFKEIGNKTFTNVREMLQVIGTDVIRKYNSEWHIDKTIEHIKELNETCEGITIIVDDVRFPNEKCKLEEIGCDVFFVMRPNFFNVSNHASEVALSYDDFCHNKIIINDVSEKTLCDEFIKFYYEGKSSEIILSNNPWYCEHKIDMTSNDPTLVRRRGEIINLVIKQNKDKVLFNEKGIITFRSTDPILTSLFRRVFMNDHRSSDGCETYSIYNPITNEILKKYL